MKIVADKNIPFLKGVAEYFGDTIYLPGNEFTHDAIKDADALIVRTVTRFDEALLKNTSIKLICSATIGYDHIDTTYCDAHGITWRNAPGCNSGSVQQYVVSSLIVLARQYNLRLQDMTIGIVGVGNVGKKVAKACELLGMRVLLNDPPRQAAENSADFVDLETIKQQADIITFHTPLYKTGQYKTFHLADTSFFDTLAKKPFIINSARGGIIDTKAIKQALRGGKIAGAVIDCWENEPNIDLEYLSMVTIATPHIAGYSADGKANATRMSLASIADFFGLDKSPIDSIKEPLPENTVIDFSQLQSSNKVYDAILTTYNPLEDFARLKADTSLFKELRNKYPLRREYGAYKVFNIVQEDRTLLLGLGFML